MAMIETAPVWQMWAVFAVIVLAVTAYAAERWSLEATSVGTIVALLLLFHFAPVPDPAGGNRLNPGRLLAGFADPALIALLSLMILGQGVIRTGALESLLRRLPAAWLGSPRRATILILATVAASSAAFNNTPIVVIFIPVVVALARRLGGSASRLLMPLSFVAILGGMTTLLGSSTNILVAGSATALGYGPIGFFDFTLPGLLLALVGLVYALVVVPRLLPERASMARDLVGSEGRQYIAQITATTENGLAGQRIKAGLVPALPNMTLRLIQRGEHAFLPPFEDLVLEENDIVVVAATRASLADALTNRPGIMPADALAGRRDPHLIEAVVAPASRMIGRNLQQIGFHYQTNCLVMGVQRRSRMVRGAMDEIRLEAGDVLLILGHREAIEGLRASRDLLTLEWSAHEVPTVALANRARLIFVGVLLSVATGLLPVSVAALAGAAAMVASGCLNIHQASRAIDRRVVLLVATALALGAALQETGGADYLAQTLTAPLRDAPVGVSLAALFLAVALITNVLSNNATAVLFTPVAVSIALALEAPVPPFIYTVVFAANCSFATPIGYQTNLLVMGPGHYRFRDFTTAGGPLILVIWITFSLFAPWYYGL